MTDSDIDLVIEHASQLLTLRADTIPVTNDFKDCLGMIEDGAVAFEYGKVAAVGTTQELRGSIDIGEGTRVINATGSVVMPGFVDPHTHMVFAGSREDELVSKINGATYLEILEKGGGILRTVRATREASLEELKAQVMPRLERMLDHGTTTTEAKSGYGLDLETELKMLEAMRELEVEHPIDITPTFLGAHAVPPEYKDRSGEYIDFIIAEVLPKVKEAELASYCDIFCEKGVFGLEDSRRLLTAARKMGLGLKIHADEIENLGGSRLAAELGAVSAEHLAVTTEDEMDAMSKAGVIACLLPGTPFMLMQDHYPNARKMMEYGVPIALATDLNPNCMTESMQMVVTLACLQMRMSPEAAIVASTINAACAIGREGLVGSLDIGKKGDAIILDAPNYMHLPYHYGVNLVKTVIKDGKVVRGG